MKAAGWICSILGVLSFLGAAIKGDSVFGPLFLIGLGVFFLYRANNKEQVNNKKPVDREKPSQEKSCVQEDMIVSTRENHGEDTLHRSHQQQESIEDIQAQLTLQQREAAMCLISFFGGYNNNPMDDAPITLFKQSARFFGIPDSPATLARIMSKYSDADTLVDIVLTIKPLKAKEYLLLTCYDLIKSSDVSEAYDLLLNIANDMGYDKSRFEQLIKLYQ